MKEEDLQQKVVLYQLMQNQLEQSKQQVTLLERKMMEIDLTEQALGDLVKYKGNEILLPLASEIYAHAKPTRTNEFIVDVGAGIIVKKTHNQILEMLSRKKREIEKPITDIKTQINETIQRMNEIAQQVEKAQKK